MSPSFEDMWINCKCSASVVEVWLRHVTSGALDKPPEEMYIQLSRLTCLVANMVIQDVDYSQFLIRVQLFRSGSVEVHSFNDGMLGGIRIDKFSDVSDIPKHIQNKLAVLMIVNAGSASVQGVGYRATSSIYWVTPELGDNYDK